MTFSTILSAVLALAGNVSAADAPVPARPVMPQSAVIAFKNGSKISAEVVWTPEKMARGLMYAKGLPQGRGMIFVYATEGSRRFWMKNMLFNLDIIFIGHDGTLRQIFKNVSRPAPGAQDADIPVVEGMGNYVLEVSAGFADANSLAEGHRADIAFSMAPLSSTEVAVPQPAKPEPAQAPKPGKRSARAKKS